MDEIQEVRRTGWVEMVHQCKKSGLSVKEWCAQNGMSESTYYYRIKRLRKEALKTVNGEVQPPFVRLPQQKYAASPSDVALRIRRGDTVIEVSSSAPDSVLAFLKDVMIHAV